MDWGDGGDVAEKAAKFDEKLRPRRLPSRTLFPRYQNDPLCLPSMLHGQLYVNILTFTTHVMTPLSEKTAGC